MKYKNTQSGFSLVETLVAVSLLLIIIVGPMTISAKATKSSSFASEQVQAFFLAQEGLELAQKARDDYRLRHYLEATDSNYLDNAWNSFVNYAPYAPCFGSAGCGLYWNSDGDALAAPKDCTTSTNCKIYRNSVSNSRALFTHDVAFGGLANTQTVFTRKIIFEVVPAVAPDPSYQILVKSEVTWRTGSIIADQKVMVQTYLFNTDYDPS